MVSHNTPHDQTNSQIAVVNRERNSIFGMLECYRIDFLLMKNDKLINFIVNNYNCMITITVNYSFDEHLKCFFF